MSDSPFILNLEDGKYTVISHRGIIKAERYREPWRDLTGDKLIGALVCEVERLQHELANTENLGGVSVRHPTVKKWRYDALRAATGIARHYGEAFKFDEAAHGAAQLIANDIEAMIPPEER